MSIKALVAELVDKNIHLWLEDGKLKFRAPKTGLPDALRDKIVQHRAGLIALLGQQQGRAEGGLVPAERGQPLPLSLEQERLWFLHQFYDDVALYNMAWAFEWRGPVDVAALDTAIRRVIARHEILRTRIEVVNGSPRQVPMDQSCWELAVEDHRGVDGERRKAICQAAYEQEMAKVFDLARGEVMRTRLLRFEHDAVLIFSMDHIASDAWSQNILIAELCRFYQAAANNVDFELPPLPIQYADYAVWQRQRLASGKLRPSIDFWRDNLDPASLQTRLPADLPRPAARTFRGASVAYVCGADTLQRVKQLCDRLSVTVPCVLLSAYALLVSRYASRSVVAFGVPTAGREQPELQGLIGFFVNAIVCRIEVPGSGTAGDFIRSVQDTLLKGLEHQQVPVEHLAEIIQQARGTVEHLDVPMAFNYVEEDERAIGTVGDALSAALPVVPCLLGGTEVAAKHELTLALNASTAGIRGSMDYNADLFLPETIERFLADFDSLLRRLVGGSEQAIRSVSWYDDTDVLLWLHAEHPDASLAFPLSPVQRDIYFSAQLNPLTQRNNLGYAAHMFQPVDTDRWKAAVGMLVGCNDMLRVRLHRFKDARVRDVYQWLSKDSLVDYSFHDWTRRAGTAGPEALDEFIDEFIHRPFDVDGGLLHRHALIKLAHDHHVSVLAVHHVLFDGGAVLAHGKRLADIYLSDEGAELRHHRLDDFRSHAAVCGATMDTREILDFWRQQLAAVEALQVPPMEFQTGLVTRTQPFEKDLWDGVKRYCRCLGITPAIYCKGVYGLLIHHYFQAQSDFLITEFNLGRTEAQLEELGCYYRQQPFVFRHGVLQGGTTFADFWGHHKDFQRASKPFSGLSPHAQAQMVPQQNIGFMYNYNGYIKPSDVLYGNRPGDQQGFIPRIEDAVQFYVKNVAEEMQINLVYPDGTFADDRLLERFMSVTRQLCAGDCPTLSAVDFVLADEARVLAAWESGHVSPATCTDPHASARSAPDVLALFSSQVRAHGGRVAVADAEVELTYAALDAQSDALALCLLDRQVKPGDKVALLLPRDHRFAVAMLAVAKASACYVPLDPAHPSKRIDYILEDAGVAVVVTCEQLSGLVAPESQPLLLWESVSDALANAPSSGMRPPAPQADPARDFYVIYTSGTTGNPKGVLVSAGNVASLFHGCDGLFDLGPTDTWSVCHSFAFDFSVWELWGPLTTGGRACVVDAATIKDSPRFHSWLQENRVSVLSQTPSAFLALELADRQRAGGGLECLRYVVFGGEALDINHLHEWRARYALGQPALINMYGITEITVHATFHEITQADFDANRNAIGKALPHLATVILDDCLRRVPPGFPGELFVAGGGVTKGYLHREALTQERFISLPRLGHGDARFYRSGDRARYLPDGDLQYLGRNDRQVKIRGYRIELDEIENVLRGCDGVVAGAVKVVDFGEPVGQRIVAYVCREGESTAELAPAMQARLPQYMVPSDFVVLPQLPLTDNGKIDYRALPLPNLQAPADEDAVLETPTEIRLAEIVGELLQQRVVSKTANFFALGGHSLLATQLASRIEQQFNVEMPLRAVFQHARLHELADDIDRRCGRLAGERADGLINLPGVAVPLSDPRHPDKLFCIHSGTGEAFSYQALAERLAPDVSVWGIQAPGYEADTAVAASEPRAPLALEGFASFALLARHYCDAMVQIQPEGPYRVLGWSSGGLLALEIVRLLQERGETVDFVGMVDTQVPNPGRFDYTLDNLVDVQDLDAEALRQHPLAFPLGAAGGGGLPSAATLNHFIRIARHLRQLEGAHAPVMPAGRVHLFVAEDPSAVEGADWLVPGWAAMNGGELRMHTVPGDHFTALDRHHAGAFAKLISDILGQETALGSRAASLAHPVKASRTDPASPAELSIDTV